MLKKSLFSPAQPRCAKTHLSPSVVLASFRPSTYQRSFSEVGNAVGVYPLAKTHCKGERPTRSAVCTSSALHSLRPCLGVGASWRARVGRVRRSPFEHPAGRLRYPKVSRDWDSVSAHQFFNNLLVSRLFLAPYRCGLRARCGTLIRCRRHRLTHLSHGLVTQ